MLCLVKVAGMWLWKGKRRKLLGSRKTSPINLGSLILIRNVDGATFNRWRLEHNLCRFFCENTGCGERREGGIIGRFLAVGVKVIVFMNVLNMINLWKLWLSYVSETQISGFRRMKNPNCLWWRVWAFIILRQMFLNPCLRFTEQRKPWVECLIL